MQGVSQSYPRLHYRENQKSLLEKHQILPNALLNWLSAHGKCGLSLFAENSTDAKYLSDLSFDCTIE